MVAAASCSPSARRLAVALTVAAAVDLVVDAAAVALVADVAP